ncbi:Delta(3,5)-Delta(2,4)-dienoyl-CoA isomerase [Gaeumannomyces tritici R3-111a-1]|uniref:Delta(3,5)-Delta(2,4)-dienoyl-CoA isomerase n=1 Tax=Gaeumannomyces tritici (strain R3-111a-1) TaxID=644352 RepID=J3PHA4_GAET3|nr:Delta(3,5)-Delta(2,4)-dienoyl-CoA isomerase [Gaeumannomyces tritici R3-111a-1]EJT69264.1 Delta(3,5)-Delta(2,4)-dienoyl-CoA isomerase [Gaeumannomyces tritici R3-111a-1]
MSGSVISLEYRGRLAIITIDNEKKLNALNQQGYYDLSQRLREVATHDEVYITLLTAKGRYFSAGADVSLFPAAAAPKPGQTRDEADEVRREWLTTFVAFNLNVTQAFFTHPKVLVVGLNGPVVGLSAALVAFADFIYCTPSAFLLTPFSSLGLVTEGGASHALVQRLGVSRANEALIMSRRIPAAELLASGFVNKVFEGCEGDGGDAKFREKVLAEIDSSFGEHLVGDSLVGIKALIRRPHMDVLERQNAAEVFAGLERFVSGVPQKEFAKIASGQKRHKL